jgi:DNA polymerase-3 subunit epsilon
MRIAIFDTETTGLTLPSIAPLEKQPRIIELGVVLVEGGEFLSSHNWLINPGELITEEITKITGITNNDLDGKPTFEALLDEITEVFYGCEIGIAHNAPFDTAMISSELKRCLASHDFLPHEMICSVQEYVHVFGKRPKLTELYERYVGKPLLQTHRASDDAMAVYEALKADNFFEKIGAI